MVTREAKALLQMDTDNKLATVWYLRDRDLVEYLSKCFIYILHTNALGRLQKVDW